MTKRLASGVPAKRLTTSLMSTAAAVLLLGSGIGIANISAAPQAAAQNDTAVSVGLGYNYDPEKQDQPKLTVEYPEGGLALEGESTATLHGENYATTTNTGGTFGGAYTMFGVIELQDEGELGSWAPTQRGVSGKNYDYAGEAGKFQLMVNYPGNSTEPGMPSMNQNGDWTIENHPLPGPQFTSQNGVEIDCLADGVQCGFMTIGAHGQRSAGVEVFTPVEFGPLEEPDVDPTEEPTLEPTQPVDPDPTDDPTVPVVPDPTDDPTVPVVPDPTGEPTDEPTLDPTLPEADVCDVQEIPADAELTVVGDPLEGTNAVMTVVPGRYLPCDDTTEVTVSGSGYDHTEPIYVGFGTTTNHDDLEQWRRSNGGLSGSDGDYDYGMAQLISASHESDEGSAVNMDTDGNWNMTLEIPGKDIESFFGGTIDCVESYCGFFSFGAKGLINADNEAFTPVYFGNQDPSGTPEPTPTPTGEPSQEPADSVTPTPTAGTGNVASTGGGTTPNANGNPGQVTNNPDGTNNQNLAGKGNLANTGLDGNASRTLAIGGALLLSAGLFVTAIARYRKTML